MKGGQYGWFGIREQVAVAYADKLTRAPNTVSEADFSTLMPYFSEAEIVDLHLLIGLANLTNRFTDPLGLELEFAEERI